MYILHRCSSLFPVSSKYLYISHFLISLKTSLSISSLYSHTHFTSSFPLKGIFWEPTKEVIFGPFLSYYMVSQESGELKLQTSVSSEDQGFDIWWVHGLCFHDGTLLLSPLQEDHCVQSLCLFIHNFWNHSEFILW